MKEFDKLKEIISTLRHPETGCPWDLKQSSKTLISGMIEEVYEVSEAVASGNNDDLKEELGDCLLHIMLQAQIASEKGSFAIEEVVEGISAKLIRRHPHIFGEENLTDPTEVKKRWEQIKLAEKKERNSVLDGIPQAIPGLLQAQRIQEKAASVGFDWDNIEPVFAKITEEIAEVRAEISSNNQENLELEIGDLLFSVVNLARKLNVDAELAIKTSNRKFRDRFSKIEAELTKTGTKINEKSLEELDQIWESVKKTE
ncbi:nucleoside triphosphate pyrophosphohydrolase [bacterium]|nr:nucleoside triphosphate pyrophosphohydrolase [bacterium]